MRKFILAAASIAAIACTELIKAMGVPHDNVIMCDRSGVIYQGRTEGMDQWKSAHAAKTSTRNLAEAIVGSGARSVVALDADAYRMLMGRTGRFGGDLKGLPVQHILRTAADWPSAINLELEPSSAFSSFIAPETTVLYCMRS